MPTDPYRYFRVEAQELSDQLSAAFLDLRKATAAAEVQAATARALRCAHTLKGAAAVVKHRPLAELAHAFESSIEPWRQTETLPLAAALSEPTRLVDAIADTVQRLREAQDEAGPQASAPGPVVQEAGPPAPGTLRVELRRLDGVIDRARALTLNARALRAALDADEAPAAETASSRAVAHAREALDALEGGLEELRGALGDLRMLPVADIVVGLERGVMRAADEAGVKVRFAAQSGDQRLDAHALGMVRDALVQVMRNAVAHGIEPPAARMAAGKPEVGRVTLNVLRRGSRLGFVCRDDGRGVDAGAVKARAAERGLTSAGETNPLDAHALSALLLGGGVSTAASTNQLAGRGVGLSVVREAIARLHGDAVVKSTPGAGTTVEIWVPMSLASLPMLRVRAGEVDAGVPVDAVIRTLRVGPEDVVETPTGSALVEDGAALPFVRLTDLLGVTASAPTRARTVTAPARQLRVMTVIVQGGARQAALAVDELIGTEIATSAALPDVVGATALVAGATIDELGRARLVLDPVALVDAAHAQRVPRARPAPPPRPLPILVVDDSITTRMLEQSILEAAGYDVEVASSAEEAMEKAALRSYGLFIVDVEMPGMTGFEFVARTRRDPRLLDTPAVLVSSRAAAEDRARGLEAGARAYIVKGEFDQPSFLSLIQELVSR